MKEEKKIYTNEQFVIFSYHIYNIYIIYIHLFFFLIRAKKNYI